VDGWITNQWRANLSAFSGQHSAISA
jgi:hypothetical protein